MKYQYIAKSNIFDKDWNVVGEKILHESKLFNSEKECKNYAFQYQSRHSANIEYKVIND